jgi:UDP-N-acetylmuramate--alanine ligase
MSFAHRRLHLLGAGGAGMSALATVAYAWGADVSGCDRGDSSYAQRLQRFGIPVARGHDAGHLEAGMELVVSSAVPHETAELAVARSRGLRVMRRAELLAEMVAARRSICVAGAHGKTTTTAMIAYAAVELGLDPTFLVGGEVPQLGGNGGPGGGDLLVAEADESDGSLGLLQPLVAVVCNVELDHHAHFASERELWDLFAAWTAGVPAAGAVLLGDGVDLPAQAPVARFGFDEVADWRISGLELEPGGSGFWLDRPDGPPLQVRLAVPGAHNAQNAAGALAALALAAPAADAVDAAAALSRFRGAGRRLEPRGSVNGARIVDDYSHHPTEVEAAIAAARAERPARLLICFQPHLYTRTAALADRFGAALAAADGVVVTDVYPAREQPIAGVTGELVADAVRRHRPGLPLVYVASLDDAAAILREHLRDGDLLLTVGAGDVRRVGDLLLS